MNDGHDVEDITDLVDESEGEDASVSETQTRRPAATPARLNSSKARSKRAKRGRWSDVDESDTQQSSARDRSRSPAQESSATDTPTRWQLTWTQEEDDKLMDIKERQRVKGWKGIGQMHGFGRSDDACKARHISLKRKSRMKLPTSETENMRTSPAQSQQPQEDQHDVEQHDLDQDDAEDPRGVDDMDIDTDLDMSIFDPNDPHFALQYLVDDDLPPWARFRRVGGLRKASIKRGGARRSPSANKLDTAQGAESAQQQRRPGRPRLSAKAGGSGKRKPKSTPKKDNARGEKRAVGRRSSMRLRSNQKR